MVVLFVFSRLAETRSSLKTLTIGMAWGFTLLALGATASFVSCFFFDAPKSIPCLLKYECGEARALRDKTPFAQRCP